MATRATSFGRGGRPSSGLLRGVLLSLTLLPAALALSALASAAASKPNGGRREIAKRTFVVTGASSGFGQGLARRLGVRGANVVLAARRTDVLEEIAADIRASGGLATVVTADIGKPDDVERLAREAVSRYGAIDVWINNAAVGATGLFWDVPVEDHARIIDVNVKGFFYGSHAALRRFRAQGFGALVNVGSVEGEIPVAYQSSYAASKAAVLSLGRTLNQELRLAGTRSITVSTVMPYAVDTPWWTHTANYSGRSPRMVAMDDPAKVVDAVIRLCLHPQPELAVGWKAKASIVAQRLAPRTTERFSSDVQHAALQKAPRAGNGPGTVHEPMAAGATVAGGARERIKREDRASRRASRRAPSIG